VIGDRLLQSIAQRLLGCVRASDTVSRQGGGFVILLPEVTHAQDATDTLKIDRSFVRNITNSDDASIVCAVISMGKNLHMRVVAEGVETRAQLSFLQDHECPFGQGYYFSQPLTGQACTQLLRRGIAADGLQVQPCGVERAFVRS
jgi:predicted signal transduction protein with EAL and GGDEF domain